MTRNKALKDLALGYEPFDRLTAQEVLDSNWNGLQLLDLKDKAYFEMHGSKSVMMVAKACLERSATKRYDPLLESPTAVIMSVELKERLRTQSRDMSKTLNDYIVSLLEKAAALNEPMSPNQT